MFGYSNIGKQGWGMRGLAAALLLMGATIASAQEADVDSVLEGWLGGEFTVESSTLKEGMPLGGKLSFAFDSKDNVVRVCTRNASDQNTPWKMDFANSCAVTMTFTKGARFCSFEDVKTGNAELLASCHRLRSRDVAMHPAKVKGTVELNDMIAFLVQGTDGKKYMSILVDSPSRVTDEGTVIIGGHK
jgi:hypothetical protein